MLKRKWWFHSHRLNLKGGLCKNNKTVKISPLLGESRFTSYHSTCCAARSFLCRSVLLYDTGLTNLSVACFGLAFSHRVLIIPQPGAGRRRAEERVTDCLRPLNSECSTLNHHSDLADSFADTIVSTNIVSSSIVFLNTSILLHEQNSISPILSQYLWRQ